MMPTGIWLPSLMLWRGGGGGGGGRRPPRGVVSVRAGEKSRLGKVLPCRDGFEHRAVQQNLAVAVAIRSCGDVGEIRRGGVVITRIRAVTVPEPEERDRDLVLRGGQVAHSRTLDQLLALEHGAQQHADDHQHDRDLDQRKTGLIAHAFSRARNLKRKCPGSHYPWDPGCLVPSPVKPPKKARRAAGFFRTRAENRSEQSGAAAVGKAVGGEPSGRRSIAAGTCTGGALGRHHAIAHIERELESTRIRQSVVDLAVEFGDDRNGNSRAGLHVVTYRSKTGYAVDAVKNQSDSDVISIHRRRGGGFGTRCV